MHDDVGKPADSWNERMARDRRVQPRYKLTTSVELADVKTGARIKGTITELSVGGCQVETGTPFAVGTSTDINITKGNKSFGGQARVVYFLVGKGMGLMFTTIEPRQFQVLEKLLAESLETSWVTSNRRRNQRILMQVPVGVSGYDEIGSSFKEKTHTISVSPRGALILLSTPVRMGQRLVLSNIQTKSMIECAVVYKGGRQGDRIEVGVHFWVPNPAFWGVAFPPEDWSPQHPDAKPRKK